MDVEDVEHEQTFARFRQQFDAWDAWEADTHQRAFTRFQQQFDAWDAKDEWETNTHQQAFTRFQQQFDAWGVKDTKNAQEANTQPLNGLDTVHIKNQNDVSKGADEKQLNTAHRQAFDKFQRNHRSIDISVLENPRWLRKAGMSKGIDHDRQALNFILPAGNGFRIRQTNKNFTQSLTLRLLNDDHVNESAYSILPARYGWKNISHSSTSVLFIDTPYVEGHQDKGAMPVIEIDWHPGDIKELPRYRRGDNEAAFFRTWDGEDAEFALLESDYIRILVPKKDKNVVRHLDQHNKNPTTIDKLLDHYDTVIPFFNKLAGLDFDAKQPWNRNPKNKYFAKADKSGPGTGYYGNHWTAESGGSDSVATFWLLDKDNWGRLHEIAHGYQGHFLHDGLFHEVWNNIYAASWQNAQLGNRVFQEGWLYDYGHAEALVATVHHHLASRVPLKQWDAREKLYFMMLMKDKAGDAAFIHFNQEYRKKAADPTFNAEQHNLLDMLAESYAIAGGIDVRPLIQLVDSGISERLSSSDAFNTAVPVLPLNQIITDDSSQKEVQNLLKLDSPLRLVSAADLAEVGLAGNLTVALDNLAGKNLTAALDSPAGKNLTAALDSPAGKNLTAALDSYDKEHQALHAVQDVVTTIQNTFGPPTYQYHNGGNGRTDNWVPERTGFRTPNATEQTHQRHYFLPGNNPGHQYNNRWGEIHRRGKTNIPFVQNTFRPPTYQYHNGGNGSMEEMMAIFPSAQSASVYPAVTYPATATMHNINYPLSLPQYQLQQ